MLSTVYANPSRTPEGSTTVVERHPPSGISVLVVGGGPVGVYTALECWRKGHKVRIIERSPMARTQGEHTRITYLYQCLIYCYRRFFHCCAECYQTHPEMAGHGG
jgi:hypothetical protein